MKVEPVFKIGAPRSSPTLHETIAALTLASLLLAPAAARSGAEAVEPTVGGEAATPNTTRRHGLRERLATRGVEATVILQADPSTNMSGGTRRGATIRVPFQAAFDVDAERLFGWRGGRLHAGVQALEGRNATDELVGDLQGFNNVDSNRFRQLSELWLEQRLFGDRLRVKVGKADANADFARVEASGEFLNSSAGYSPTIQGFPSYPDPAMSVSALASPARWLALGAGLFDGATHEGCHGRTGNRGLSTFLGAPSASFVVGEIGVRHALRGRAGRVSLGAWKHTGSFERFEGGTQRGTSGLYAVVEQRVHQEPVDESQGLSVFVQLGSADARVAEIDQHLALGLSASGPLPGRDRDVVGLMLTSVTLSAHCATPGRSRRESVIELFYGLALRPWLVLKPDLQYILNPGAAGSRAALVATLRVTLAP